MSPAPLRSRVNEARVFFTSAETTRTCANRLAGQFGRSYLSHRATLGDTPPLARLAGWWVIVLLYLFVAGSLTAQTPDPSPPDAPQPEAGLRLALFPDIKIGTFYKTRPNELIFTTD